MTRALGVRCSKDTLDWAMVEGDDRASASVIDSARVTAPAGSRGEQLGWARKEILEILSRHAADVVALRAAEPGGQANSLPRAEVEGVVQEAVASAGVECRRVVAASLRSAFSAKKKAELDEALVAMPLVAATAKTRRDPVTAALAVIKA